MAFELKAFYSKIYRTYDLVNHLFTMGMDRKWRKITAERCIEKNPKEVLDLCCGTGDLAINVCKAANGAKVIVNGYDFNSDMLSIAKTKAQKLKFENTKFIEGDAANIPFGNESLDAITIGFGFRNLTFENPAKEKHIEEMYRILKKDGELLILESSVPTNVIIRFFYKLYLFLFLVPLGAVISGNVKAYWYLAHSSSKFYSASQIESMLVKKGFAKVASQKFFFGAANLIIATK